MPSISKPIMHPLLAIVAASLEYWLCLAQFTFGGKRYSECSYFSGDVHARVQVFSLSLIFKLWGQKHYRSASFQQDMLDNLRNVAVPGTGVPLSLFCHHKVFVLIFVFILNPILCLIGAVNKSLVESNYTREALQLVGGYYIENLLHPVDWFSLWRLNCRLVSYHSLVTKSSEYKMEDKWTFLVQGKEMGVPVSPFFDNLEAVVCKNKLIEGGMGIHFFKNAAFGGDWIIQEKLANADWLNDLLPGNAPLSTMRVITTSSYSLSEEYPLKKGLSVMLSSTIQQEVDNLEEDTDSLTTGPASVTVNYSNGQTARYSAASSEESSLLGRNLCEMGDVHVNVEGEEGECVTSLSNSVDEAQISKYIKAESAVLRLGRANASTDHSSILFDVDTSTGVIRGGTTNSHWYQLGLAKAAQTPWLPPYSDITHHLDAPFPEVKGKAVPDMKEALRVVTSAHYRMMAEVPIVGWDVAFTPNGIFLLEVNLSCNFFGGSFDVESYVDMIDKYWLHLEKIEELTCEQSQSTSVKKYSRSSSSLKKDT